MGYEHVHVVVQDLSIHVEELRNSLMDHPVPFLYLPFQSTRLKADAVSPGMAHLSNLEVQLVQLGVFIHFVALIYELHDEAIEVC